MTEQLISVERLSTQPGHGDDQNGMTPHLVVSPTYKDSVTGALYMHKDLELASLPYEDEAHIAPVRAQVPVGNLEAWAKYVSRYGDPATTFATYSEHGLNAVLDYHTPDAPGRAQWVVYYEFNLSPQFQRWYTPIVLGQVIDHQTFVELLEDGMEAIVTPEAAAVMDIVRMMRVTYEVDGGYGDTARTGRRPLSFNADTQIRGSRSGEVELPSHVTIQANVLQGGDSDSVMRMQVRLRTIVDEDGQLSFRLSAPDFDEGLARIYAGMAQKAQAALSDNFDGFEILAG